MERSSSESNFVICKAKEFDNDMVQSALPSIIGFLEPNYPGNGDSSGSGFVLDDNGTILTAYHVYENISRKWGSTNAISLLTNEGVLSYSNMKFINGDKEEDYAILKTQKLAGRGGIPISNSQFLSYDKPYYLIGYPYSFRDFPYHFQCAVSIGEKKLQKNIYPEVHREFLTCRIWGGFSGAPIIDTEGFARAIVIAGTMSLTSGEADILPLNAIKYKF